jgi:hypothetical protein
VDKAVVVPPPQTSGRWAFVSKSHPLGGGIDAADARCQAEATAAELPGTYLAVLPVDGASAADRFNLSGDPWVRMDGVRIAPTASDFFNAAVWESSPILGADGTVYELVNVWGGAASLTTPGTLASTCDSWTSTDDQQSVLTGRVPWAIPEEVFAYWEVYNCSMTHKLVCLQE